MWGNYLEELRNVFVVTQLIGVEAGMDTDRLASECMPLGLSHDASLEVTEYDQF
jgi:hypothetical protein